MASEPGRRLKYNISKDELYRKYVEEGMSIKECAEFFGCSTRPIEDRLRKYDIEVRPRGNQRMDIPADLLRQLYVDEGFTTKEIAERFDCHNSTISRRLKEYGISTVGPNHSHSVRIPEDELVQLYVDEERTTYELAETFGCDPTVIERRLRWFGIETRHTSAGHGTDHYKYGVSWRRQREKALEAADYRCERCGISNEDHQAKYFDRTRGVGYGLDVHHRVSVRLFKKWEAPDVEDANALSNLEVLCQECHRRYGDRVGISATDG